MAAQIPTEALKELKVADGAQPAGEAGNAANGQAEDAHDEDSEDDAEDATPAAGAAKKKKKRKPKKKKKNPTSQSEPPRVMVSQLFPNKNFPKGEEVEYKDDNNYRTTNEEKRHLDNLNSEFLADYREAAEIHRQVRQYAQKVIKPGQSLTEIAETIEDSVRALTGHAGLDEGDALKAGMGFPLRPVAEPLRGALHPQRGQQDGAAAKRRHEGGLWRPRQRQDCRLGLYHGL
ncbi:uncharacterized protein TrAtP1_006973 [Trichoderma atroviride]|uniref:uncharacterized protein n=1 Tax=Hypocrea atroviridis TaxID=63577 RepID=UPI00331F01A8|nr:hypothetical protein TrAtP1_006973 [Trichoderma atroviride]